jgi:hypothetical protein
MEPRTFFSVSLISNLATLQKSIPIILRIYPDATYYLICKKNDSTYFVENLPNHERLVVLSENTLMTYEKFLTVYNEIKSFQSSENSRKRLPWYYQQALKIIFVLKSSILFQERFPIVMFDADSIPLRKMKFFNDNNSVLYGSLSERHLEYFKTLEVLFGKFDYPSMGFTTQFFSSTLRESLHLMQYLKKYDCNKKVIDKTVANAILQSTLEAHNTIDGSRFSEQEFFGISNRLYSKNLKQVPVFSFRSWVLDGILSKNQMKVLSVFGVSLVTYENRPEVDAKVLRNRQFIYSVLSDMRPQLSKFIRTHLKSLMFKL